MRGLASTQTQEMSAEIKEKTREGEIPEREQPYGDKRLRNSFHNRVDRGHIVLVLLHTGLVGIVLGYLVVIWGYLVGVVLEYLSCRDFILCSSFQEGRKRNTYAVFWSIPFEP